MYAAGTAYLVFFIVVAFFAIGSFLALPWIWYHAGFISRKLDKTNHLLVSIMKRLPELDNQKPKEKSDKKRKGGRSKLLLDID